MEATDRSFTVVNVDTRKTHKGSSNEGGRFISKTPAGAAKKAFNAICNDSKIRGVCTMFINMKETTGGSDGKVFKYKMSRKKYNKTGKSVDVGCKKINFRYQVFAKSMNKATKK